MDVGMDVRMRPNLDMSMDTGVVVDMYAATGVPIGTWTRTAWVSNADGCKGLPCKFCGLQRRAFSAGDICVGACSWLGRTTHNIEGVWPHGDCVDDV